MLFLKHNLFWECLNDILQLFNTIIGKPILPTSKYLFRKLLPKVMKPKYNYFCKKCYKLLDSKSIKCDICDEPFSLDKKKNNNFFITLPIKSQIISTIKKNINYITRGNSMKKDVIEDVSDGELYNQISVEENAYPITLTLNTDGIKIFKSSSTSQLWPIQFHCNELDPHIRFTKRNIGICGFWFGKHPVIEIFMKFLVLEVQELNRKLLKVRHGGKTYKFHVMPLLFTMDTIAKDMVQCKIQFNGYFGCSYCLHPGTLVNKNNIRYVIKTVSFQFQMSSERWTSI